MDEIKLIISKLQIVINNICEQKKYKHVCTAAFVNLFIQIILATVSFMLHKVYSIPLDSFLI